MKKHFFAILADSMAKKKPPVPFRKPEADVSMVPDTGIEPARDFPWRSKHHMSTIPSIRHYVFVRLLIKEFLNFQALGSNSMFCFDCRNL